MSAPECLEEALFQPWHRSDPTFSFRWDPDEDVRYALMAGDPTGGEGWSKIFSLAWPIWRHAATLPAIRALMLHPSLRQPGGLTHLGVDHVLVARKASVGRYDNFARARATQNGPP